MAIQIIDYLPQHQVAFKEMNKRWIDKYFEMEEIDYKSLDNPNEYILDKGGHILVVTDLDKVVGVCALIKMDHPKYDFELAKMAVDPDAHGKGIGYQLGLAILEKAKAEGANYVYLESNTVLTPAINLYRKLGFIEVIGIYTPYTRCNIQMEIAL